MPIKNIIIGLLAVALALSVALGVLATQEQTVSVDVTVWQNKSSGSLYVSTRPEGGSWTTHPGALDMSGESRSGRYWQSDARTVEVVVSTPSTSPRTEDDPVGFIENSGGHEFFLESGAYTAISTTEKPCLMVINSPDWDDTLREDHESGSAVFEIEVSKRTSYAIWAYGCGTWRVDFRSSTPGAALTLIEHRLPRVEGWIQSSASGTDGEELTYHKVGNENEGNYEDAHLLLECFSGTFIDAYRSQGTRNVNVNGRAVSIITPGAPSTEDIQAEYHVQWRDEDGAFHRTEAQYGAWKAYVRSDGSGHIFPDEAFADWLSERTEGLLVLKMTATRPYVVHFVIDGIEQVRSALGCW